MLSGRLFAARVARGEGPMPSYKAPVDDVMFLLNDVFHIERYSNLPGFADASPDLVEAVLGEAAKLCEHVLTPLNRIGDKAGCDRGIDRPWLIGAEGCVSAQDDRR